MRQYLILGPPGTGKTTFLLDEVQRAMADGVHPSRIAYVSFTRKAASEAITRAVEKFSSERDDFPFFRTLHSLAFQQLNLSPQQVMGSAEYRALGEALGLVFSDYMDFEEGLPVSARNGDQVLFIVSMARATLRTVKEQYDDTTLARDVSWHEVKRFAETLEAYKRDTGMLDFSDMLDRFIDECRPLDIDVAFIDEAQDLSKQQWRMVRHAMSRAKNVYIAGDDDQAIYRWSGADVDSFLELPGERLVLAQSYRLPIEIYQACQAISSRISRRFDKQWSSRPEHGTIDVLPLEALEINEGSYLMLARNRYLLDRMANMVHTNGIPYTLRGRSIVDPEAVQAIKHWEHLRRGDSITGAEARSIYSYMKMGEGYTRGHKKLPGVEDDAPLTLQTMKDEHGLTREDPWYESLTKIPYIEREFYQAALRRGEKLSQPPRININTIHGVKGGEADHVVVLSDIAARTFAEYERAPDDEHRVAYVAASRARHTLTIITPRTTRAYPYLD